jgi:glycosyltransferase involved in cell wall biosynthesis
LTDPSSNATGASLDGSTSAASVAVIIPAWREPESIAAVLSEVPPGVARWIFVVVGDGRDPTAEVALEHGAIPLVQSCPGYGMACSEGASAAMARGADVLAFLDGDHSDPPSALPRLLRPVLDGTSDLVLGVRDSARYPTAIPVHARVGNGLVLALLAIFLGRRFRDLPSFKVIRADAFASLALQERTYGWTVEMLVKAARADLRIAEFPVPYRPRLAGKSKVSGTVRGTVGAGWKLLTSATRYAAWAPARPIDVGAIGQRS